MVESSGVALRDDGHVLKAAVSSLAGFAVLAFAVRSELTSVPARAGTDVARTT
jgi:hypothetical protein